MSGAKTNDYSRTRLILPARGERWSCQSDGLQDAKRIALAFASVGHAAKGIALAFGQSSSLHAAKGNCSGVCLCGHAAKRIAPAFASVGHVAVLPVHFFLSLFNLLCRGDAFACGVDEVFRYNGPHD